MGFYYSAIDDNDATRANNVHGGPCPDTSAFPSIHEQGVMASPHLWELTAIAKGIPYKDCTSELVPVWPAVECSTAEPIAFSLENSSFRSPAFHPILAATIQRNMCQEQTFDHTGVVDLRRAADLHQDTRR